MIAFLKKVWAWGEPIGAQIARKPKTWVVLIGFACAAIGHTLPDDTVTKLAADIASIFAL
ncbi:MAG: hypothetical protein JSR91_00140 [Proteobacteria bacterium]|nr:hypothetical protein [Pseudomonadota bacterium]